MTPVIISRYILAVVIIICTGFSVASADIVVTDTSGEEITLPHAASRIVCLNGDAAEMLVVLGAGDRIVGLTSTTMDDQILMDQIPNAVDVGDWQTPSVERILQLQPDAVITYSSSKPKNADQLNTAGIPLIYLDCYKIATLKEDALSMEKLIGVETAADEYLSWVKTWEDFVEKNTVELGVAEYPRVYIEGYSDFSAQGKDSGSDMLVSLAKGDNIARELEGQWPKVTPEWVIQQNPEIILKVVAVKPDADLASAWEKIMNRDGFSNLQAIASDKVYALNAELTLGPRSPAGLVYVASILHPDLVSSADAQKALSAYTEKFLPGADTVEEIYPSAS
ncbi:MAG: ABC transporter substrate-binding protein [Methanospirillaceae archaeon]|nr:ABC transporter substrate-binding protein [Methanospirillaceae archaeon]